MHVRISTYVYYFVERVPLHSSHDLIKMITVDSYNHFQSDNSCGQSAVFTTTLAITLHGCLNFDVLTTYQNLIMLAELAQAYTKYHSYTESFLYRS